MPIARMPDRALWTLPAEFNIYQVAQLKLELQDALAHDMPLDCNLAAVEDIDTAGVQLLLAARAACSGRALGFRLTAHAPASLEALQVLGLDPATLDDAWPTTDASAHPDATAAAVKQEAA